MHAHDHSIQLGGLKCRTGVRDPPIEHLGQVERAEMYCAFNMGVGMVLVLSRKGALEARCVFPELITVGYIREGNGVVLEM